MIQGCELLSVNVGRLLYWHDAKGLGLRHAARGKGLRISRSGSHVTVLRRFYGVLTVFRINFQGDVGISAEKPQEWDYEQDQITAALGLFVHKLGESDRARPAEGAADWENHDWQYERPEGQDQLLRYKKVPRTRETTVGLQETQPL